MTVSVINGQLKVTLTEAETVKFNIDRVFFDKASSDAAKALTYLLKTAAATANYSVSATRFAIELYPVFEGGCEVWYIPELTLHPTVKCKAKTAVKRWSVFEFNTSDSMLLACQLLYSDTKTRYCVSSLHRLDEKYRLLVSGLSLPLHQTVSCNFADKVLTSSLDRAKTLEHWRPICLKNAVAVIGSAMNTTAH